MMISTFLADSGWPRKSLLALAISISMSGCATIERAGNTGSQGAAAFIPLPIAASNQKLADSIERAKLTTASRQLAAEGVKALDARQFKKANDLFNLALKTDLNNSYLHFLNALVYHYRGLEGESSLFALAEQGYDLATQYDGSNVTARHFRGLLHMDRREYAQAQHHLTEATLYTKDNPELLYDLAVAAYLNKDAQSAYAALQGLQALGVDAPSDLKTLRGLAIASASLGDSAGAARYLDDMRKSGVSAAEANFVSRRVDTWNSGHEVEMRKTQFGVTPRPGSVTPPINPPTQPGMQPGMQPGVPTVPGQLQPGLPGLPGMPGTGLPMNMGGQFGAAGGFVDKQMVMVDVVIVSSEDDNSNTMGVNLLDGLKAQFGSTTGTPAWSRTNSQTYDALTGAVTTATRTITRSIGLAGVNYTLNIANASERSNEVLARPTLVALAGQTSQFFSGVDVVGAAVSSGQGSSVQVQKEVGVRLAVTPEFLPDNMIRLQVVAERTFLTNPSSNVVFDFRLDTTKTIVNANVAMRFGETLIMSGLSERDKGADNSGVPVLRDVPLAQYLFAKKAERDYQKSVLIMITPRRPQYTNRDQNDVNEERAKYSERDRVQAEFEDKYRLWFKAIPNTAFIKQRVEESSLYREFRTGDLEMPSWVSRRSHAGQLRAAMDFLFF